MKTKEIGIEEIHDLELDILKEISRICEKHEIRFYLQAGSVLGAVRHGGFIPWDEDADVIIPMNQYKAFESACKEELDKRYKLYTCNNKNSNVFFMRISLDGQDQLCAYVDVFILVGVPSDKKKQEQFMKRSKFYNQLRLLRFVKIKREDSILKNIGRLFIRSLVSCIPLSLLNKVFFDHCETISYSKAEYVMNPCGKYGVKNLFKKNIYGSPVMVKFETVTLPIPKEYEFYLKQYYNDYMKFPSQEVMDKGLNHRVIYYEQ